ncbi:PAS and ANTAR domain-containing protein [Cellulosimicrobium sp. CUA-896]|uniref:PAS and ANTAR domain-containing protein n=1 Tax=Cellulosimicrobium sp. CUA-896 TaxID=1517881 RepID=UPI00095B6DFA|nr:PAS and ANTAR domain-containing protein [Cellulosimicrobium sp. CUA-896]OLT54669.1 diguanylate cyclase [Cellulosimicrobium sp. CUA-896]
MTAEPLGTERARAAGEGELVGRYTVDPSTDRWWWSDETYRIHGFAPHEVVPTTDLVLAHKHPEDRDRVRATLATAATTGEPFRSVHRIMDGRGCERTLVLVGEGRRDPVTGAVVELGGYFVDVTSAIARRAGAVADESVRAAAASRGPIEQAKGIVAFALGTDPEDAFAVLRKASNDANVPLREVARHVVEAAVGADRSVARVAAALDVARTAPALDGSRAA